MNSKSKGNMGEAIALSEFTKRGIQVSVPFGDNARYDLIAEFNGKLNKIQVKYCNQQIRNNSILCPCASSTNHTTNKHYNTYVNDIDYFVFYLVEWNEIVIVPIEEIGENKSITFRKSIPTSGPNYHLVQDYSFSNFFDGEKKEVEENPRIKKEKVCLDCGIPISGRSTRCRKCASKILPNGNRPSRETLKELIRNTPFVKIGEQYNVSEDAVRKRCDTYCLNRTKKVINSYSDEDWKEI